MKAPNEDREDSQPPSLPKKFWKTFLEKMAIAALLFGKEVYRKKLKWFDLRRADYRLGKRAYSLGKLEGQTQLGSLLDILSERLAHLRQSGGESTSTFARKAKAILWSTTKAIRICCLKLGRRRTLKQLGAKLREAVTDESLAQEQNSACALANQVRSLDTGIGQLAPQTYPWARRPLLLTFLLLLGALIGFGTIEAHRHQLGLTNWRLRTDTSGSLSQADVQRILAQGQKFAEESARRQEEASRREAQGMEARIAAAARTYQEQAERDQLEREKKTRERELQEEQNRRVEAERERTAEEQRKEAERLAAAKEEEERIERENAQRAELERQQVERDRIAAETKRQEDEKAKGEREKAERERQQLAEEKNKQLAEAEKKKQTGEEQAVRERAEKVKAFRDGFTIEMLANARLKILCHLQHRVGEAVDLCTDKAGNLYGAGDGPTLKKIMFRVTPNGEFTSLSQFDRSDFGPSDATGLVQGNDGNFYGATSQGVIYRITPEGQFSVIHKHGGVDLHGGLIPGKDGNFYGVSRQGGTAEGGTIFKVTPSGALTTLHNFVKGSDDGWYPEGGLIQASDGSFYGTTSSGGTHGERILQMTSKGRRYAPEEKFGTRNGGTIFRMTPAGEVTTVHRLSERVWNATDEREGSHPNAPLVEGNDRNFYGTTSKGGQHGWGTVFKVTREGELTVHYDFKEEGAAIRGFVRAADENLYGITRGIFRDRDNCGTIFRIDSAGKVNAVYVFKHRSGSNGWNWFGFDDPITPVSRLLPGSDGKLYGLTRNGGEHDAGVLFKFDPSDSFVPSEEDKLKAERIASTASPPERRHSGAEIVTEIAGGILERAAEADAAHLNHSKSVVAASGGAKMLCPKCGGSKKMVQHDYNSSSNPYRAGTLPGALFENGRNTTSVVNCDRCGGTGVVDAR